MIGDNKHQGEFVAPEDKLRKLIEESNGGNNSKTVELLNIIIQLLRNKDYDLNLYLDGYEMDTRLEKIRKKRKFATNGG